MNKFGNVVYKTRKFIVDFVKKNSVLIAVIGIALVCSIAIAIAIYAQVTNKKIIDTDNNANNETYQKLKQDFNNLFDNKENKYISIEYNIKQEKQRRIQC